jgi:hypothetical protein
MKIAVLIADSYGEPFETIRNTCSDQIWSNHDGKIDVFTMIGNRENNRSRILNNASNKLKYTKFWPLQRVIDKTTLFHYKIHLPSVEQVGTVLNVNISEGLRYLGPKILASASYLFEKGYDVVYKTTLSSVVQRKIMLSILEEIDLSTEFYGGSIAGTQQFRFASGANLVMNRKLFELVREHLSVWDFADYDDVALGKIARRNALEISEIETLNIDSVSHLESLPDSAIKNVPHFRCKSNVIPRDDVQIIRRLIERLTVINRE